MHLATDMRMSWALSRSLLLAELTKMPSSSVVELLDDKRLCRPTRPFQPRPGEPLWTKRRPIKNLRCKQTFISILIDVIIDLQIIKMQFNIHLLVESNKRFILTAICPPLFCKFMCLTNNKHNHIFNTRQLPALSWKNNNISLLVIGFTVFMSSLELQLHKINTVNCIYDL